MPACLTAQPWRATPAIFFLYGAHKGVSEHMISIPKQIFAVGKYLISPMTRTEESGLYTALVSIRNGSHDRVFRFRPQFSSREDAVQYAIDEAHIWLEQRAA